MTTGEFGVVDLEIPVSFLDPSKAHPQLPVELKIAGHIWQVGLLHPSIKKMQQADGLCDPENHEIAVVDGMPASRTVEVLIHEIIEALDATYALEMPHPTIQTLGVGIFQVFADNGLLHPEFLGLGDEEIETIH